MKFLRSILFFIAIGMQLPCAVVAQDEYVDSLRKEIVIAPDTSKVEIYYDLFDYYSRIDNELSDKYADTVLSYANKFNSEYWLAIAYRCKGLVKYKFGDYSAALEYYGESEKYAKEINDSRLLSKIYNNMGLIYYDSGDNNTARKYYDKALENASICEDDDFYARTLVNIANLYYAKDDYDTIFHLYDSALNIADDKDIKVTIFNNLAYLHHLTGNYDEAQNNYSKILSILDTNTDIYMYASVLNSMSSVYIQHGEYDRAIIYMAEVDSICRANHFDEIRLDLYLTYYDFYVKTKDFEQANHYLGLYDALNDSIYSIELTEQLSELENQKSELELKIRDEEISHQKTLNLILFSIIAIVLVFIVIIAFLLVKKNRLNKALNKLNADLKLRDEEISSNLDYAREIQLGCMNNGLTESNLKMFVLDRPKVVVGGDFYISQTKGDASYVVVGDCTGHGISGGFLSVLGIKSVYAAIEKYDSLPEMASFINNEFCEIVSSAENLKGESLCLSMLRICGNEVRFLGSKQKMWIVSDGNVTEYKSSNAVMGAGDEVFTEEIINVKSGDVVFLSSDGYPDQFGAEGKLKYPRFRNLLLECSLMEPDKAKSFLSAKLDSWRGDLEQTDDVMVVGIYF